MVLNPVSATTIEADDKTVASLCWRDRSVAQVSVNDIAVLIRRRLGLL
jgi:hypothetical protein